MQLNLTRSVPLLVSLALLSGCATTQTAIRNSKTIARVPVTLDAWHEAAARGDNDAYFSKMTRDAVFIGTDATERWTKSEFQAYAAPYFGRPGEPAWVYVPTERHMDISNDLRTAWVDELLENPKYGVARGVAVLERQRDGAWQIAMYSLSFPIPNDLADGFTQQIKAYESRDSAAGIR